MLATDHLLFRLTPAFEPSKPFLKLNKRLERIIPDISQFLDW